MGASYYDYIIISDHPFYPQMCYKYLLNALRDFDFYPNATIYDKYGQIIKH